MSHSFERFVALRYLRGAQGREEGPRFVRFITYIAVGGVAVGVAALLLALSVVRGFSHEIQAKIIGFGAHVQVEHLDDAPISGTDTLLAALAQLDGVTEVAPVVVEFALLRRSASDIDGVAVWGTDRLPGYLANALTAGTADFGIDDDGKPGVVIGAKLARLLNAEVGDRVTAFSMRPRAEGGLAQPRFKQFHVRGIYETSLANFDELYVFTDLAVARDLLDYRDDQLTRIDLTLANIDDAEAMVTRIEERWGFPIQARTIYEVFRSLFAWVRLQEGIIPLIVGVIFVVAAINIIGILLMVVLEKTREVGVLASMGASNRTLRRLFLWLGAAIGMVGTALGMGLALGLALLQKQYGIIPLPEEAYYMQTAPIELNALDFVGVGVFALVLCTLAAWIPAWVASRIEPIRAIRFG